LSFLAVGATLAPAMRVRPLRPLAFLLAAAAALLAGATPGEAGAPGTAVSVKVTNPSRAPRAAETVAVKLADARKLAPTLEAAKLVVVDAANKPVASQLVDMDGDDTPDEIVFQVDLGPGETKTLTLEPGTRRTPGRDEFKVYGRFVRERHDDFAWENDRIAHRMYGPDLETWKKEPLTSSGIDVWCKRVRRLLINDWYMTDDYHQDGGEGADFYSVGKSRGCGGTGIWAGDKLALSRNFTTSRVLANGPIRLVFELDYAPFEAGGLKVSERKRVTLDAGQSFDRYESTFTVVEGKPGPLQVAVGIAKHPGGTAELDRKGGWLRSWEPLKPGNGSLGCAVVAAPGLVVDGKETDSDHLVILKAQPGVPLVYHAGFGWDKSGDVADAAAWNKKVESLARELAAPVKVSLSATKVAIEDGRGDKNEPWAVRTCDAVMKRSPVLTDKWAYDPGLVLKGFERVWRATRDPRYLAYIKQTVDRLIDADGTIKGYKADDYNLDNVNMGKVLFTLIDQASDAKDRERYRKAALALRAQLQAQPRTAEGGYWHKAIYPHQMWLDGVYMASPFLAEFAVKFGEPAALDEVAAQILLAEKHLRDPVTGLLYHGWDESREQRWADPKTGRSPQFWGRAMGWYAMALVDVLEQMPASHPRRPAIVAVLRRLADALAARQDREAGVWWQVMDAPGRDRNYLEASASAMFVYALSKGVRNGWLDEQRLAPVAARGYQGILDRFVEVDAAGQVNVKSICKVAGLGGNPYRDGSYAYYTSTEVVTNDPKGVGAFILASAEQMPTRA
jgi:unsaturated rhamnogalacturonyl hydrolase